MCFKKEEYIGFSVVNVAFAYQNAEIHCSAIGLRNHTRSVAFAVFTAIQQYSNTAIIAQFYRNLYYDP